MGAGTDNPGDKLDSVRGQGQGFDDPHHARENQKLIRRAIKNRWPMPDGMLAKVLAKTDEHLDSPNDRVSSQATRTVLEMNKQNISIDQEEDKNDRLDAGKPTENVTLHKYINDVDPEVL